MFRKLWKLCMIEYDQKVGICWPWQALGGEMNRAPLAGEGTAPEPTDRAKKGIKRSLQTARAEIPINLAIGSGKRNGHNLM